ncbi:MAG: Uma2 family endonuclease [Gammaproteobacteria bacterium]|nr:Uma2 family endonuclease [Gammaproteobacteria bacterium]
MVRYERLDALTAEQQERFLPLCTDFVIELRSLSDSLADTQAKMRQYVSNGLRLGWLIDPFARDVYVYRPSADVDILHEPVSVQGNPVLAGFRLVMAGIW